MRARDRKKAKTTTRKDKKSGPPKETPTVGYPFYPPNESTVRLDSFARYVTRLEEFKRLWFFHSGGRNSELDFLAWELREGGFNWLGESRLMRRLAVILGSSDEQAFQRFTMAHRAYAEGFVNLSNKDQAKIHLMIACNLLWQEGRNRADVRMQDVKHLARQLWAESLCRLKKENPTPTNLKNARVPVVDWTLILREIGLNDLQPGKRGRKRIGNKTHP